MITPLKTAPLGFIKTNRLFGNGRGFKYLWLRFHRTLLCDKLSTCQDSRALRNTFSSITAGHCTVAQPRSAKLNGHLSDFKGPKSRFYKISPNHHHCAWPLVWGVCADIMCLVFTKYIAVHYGQTSWFWSCLPADIVPSLPNKLFLLLVFRNWTVVNFNIWHADWGL